MSQRVAEDTPRQQCADAVLMIRPAAFDYNPETAATNSMQRSAMQPRSPSGADTSNERARHEFRDLARALESEGVSVCALEDTPSPPKPDAIFPNNWVSFHTDGTVVLYPMHAANRRLERRQDVVNAVADCTGFKVTRVVDLTAHERDGRCLEGTGSLVLDHVNRVAYASLSPRTHRDVVNEWAAALDYEACVFESFDRGGKPIYHTNVLMCIGERAVVVGTGAIAPADRGRVLEHLAGTGREVIEIGLDEIEHFAGNMLELGSWDEALGDCRVLVMSATARQALAPESFARLSACTDTVLAAPIPTIETLGGGSVRCMLAEIFMPA